MTTDRLLRERRIMEIEDKCIASHHAVRLTLVEDRVVQVICIGCQAKIKMIEEEE